MMQHDATHDIMMQHSAQIYYCKSILGNLLQYPVLGWISVFFQKSGEKLLYGPILSYTGQHIISA
jgi:hypothetical protein